jgi:prepilin-type processing-associated H-X9-DG protein
MRLLPFLDQRTVYDAVNFETGIWPPSYSAPAALKAANQTVQTTGIKLFLCPSDGGPFADRGNNFRANAGVGPHPGTLAEFPDSGNGPFSEAYVLRVAQVSDGLSHTTFFSERLRGSAKPEQPSPSRDMFAKPVLVTSTADELLTACAIAAHPTSGQMAFVFTGQTWSYSGRDATLYTHAQTPNGRVPDCMHGGLAPLDMATARSLHPGGVNTLMGDGAVRFVTQDIATAVWRGFGTRSGGELVD